MDSDIYLIGSLRNDRPAEVANELRGHGFDVFDCWHAQGTDADWHWERYEKRRGHSYREALAGKAACNGFDFDYRHLKACHAGVLVMPAGKSGHLELGWILGQGKLGYILLDGEPERYDLMYKLATAVCYNVDELVAAMREAGL